MLASRAAADLYFTNYQPSVGQLRVNVMRVSANTSGMFLLPDTQQGIIDTPGADGIVVHPFLPRVVCAGPCGRAPACA